MSRDEIGMEVRFQYVGDLHPQRFRRIQVNTYIPARIDDRTGFCATEQI
jgi:hypothetical protein